MSYILSVLDIYGFNNVLQIIIGRRKYYLYNFILNRRN